MHLGALDNSGVNLVPIDGELYLIRQFYRLPESDHLFARLESGLAWQEEDHLYFRKMGQGASPDVLVW